MATPDRTASVLFVCVKNGGKSQMAAGLMRTIAGHSAEVHSAGTQPGTEVNKLSAQSLAEIVIDISTETPKPVDPELVRAVDIVVTLGREAHVEPVAGTQFENWDTDEPSERGIDGIQRMLVIRDDIERRIRRFLGELGVSLVCYRPAKTPARRDDGLHGRGHFTADSDPCRRVNSRR